MSMIIAKELESWIENELQQVPDLLPEIPPDMVVFQEDDGSHIVSISVTRRSSEGQPEAYLQPPFGWVQHLGAAVEFTAEESGLPQPERDELVSQRCREAVRQFIEWSKTSEVSV